MPPQMEGGEPIREQPGAAYSQAARNEPYNNKFVEISTQRSSGKVYPGRNKNKVSPSQRFALAFISVAVLMGITGFCLSLSSPVGMLGFVVACTTILLINAIFNMPHK